MPEGSDSLQDIIAKRQALDFVGREVQLDQFAENLEMPVNDPRRRFVFSVHGDGGVGKTFLLGQLRRVADEHGAVSAYVDDKIFSAVEAMTGIAGQLAGRGVAMKEFTRLAENYRQRRDEIESDPQAPPGIASIMTRTTALIGQQALRSVPVVGGLAAAVDGDNLAEQADELRKFLVAKLHREDARMLLSPIEALTPVFVRELAAGGRQRPLALFFDTFEQTAPFLNDWLLALLEGRYGGLPARIVITIAGRRAVERGSWSPFLGILADVPLAPFREAHVRELLALKGVTDARVIEVIIRLSGGLPLLVAMLAEHQPGDAAAVGDPSGDAVERFLKWESDPARRALALAAACPRVVNEDVLQRLIDDERDVREEFAWLRSLSFVTHRSGRCEYHAVVRSAMLRLERGQSPQRWRARHERLRDYFRARREEHASAGIAAEGSWREAILEEAYHELCADPEASLGGMLALLVHTLHGGQENFTAAVQVIVQAGEDSGSDAVGGWGARLSEALRGPGGAIAALDLLIREAGLIPPTLGTAYGTRGRLYQEQAQYEQALADLTQALECQPGLLTWVIARRAMVYRLVGRYEEAIADLDRHLELVPDGVYIYGFRAGTYRQLERFELALADYDRALRHEPGNGLLHGERGMTYLALDRREEALADLVRAAELTSEPLLTAVYRSTAYILNGRFEQALAEAAHVLAGAPDSLEAVLLRGVACRLLGRYQEAMSDLTRVVERAPGNAGALCSRGQVYLALGRYEQALADLTRSYEIKQDDPAVHYSAAMAWRGLGDEAQASRYLAEAIRLLELKANPAQDGELIVGRLAQGEVAEARRLLGEFLAGPPKTFGRRILELVLTEYAKTAGADRALAEDMLAQVRSQAST